MNRRWNKILGNLGLSQRAAHMQDARLQRASNLANLHQHRRQLLATARYSDDRRLPKFGYRVYSQSDEDGVLNEIFRRIGEGGRTFVELGAGDGVENNTLFLLMQGWRGLWVEGSARRVAAIRKKLSLVIPEGHLRVEQHFVTAGSVDSLLAAQAPTQNVDLLSIDLDGNDYYILDAIQSIAPRVIVAEYNAKFPPDFPWVMKYNEAHEWDSTDYFGASLKALEGLLTGKGYALVGCNLPGTNAFFVRADEMREELFCAPFTSENHYEPARHFLVPAFESPFPTGMGPFEVRR
jgi:hypothetical protein